MQLYKLPKKNNYKLPTAIRSRSIQNYHGSQQMNVSGEDLSPTFAYNNLDKRHPSNMKTYIVKRKLDLNKDEPYKMKQDNELYSSGNEQLDKDVKNSEFDNNYRSSDNFKVTDKKFGMI